MPDVPGRRNGRERDADFLLAAIFSRSFDGLASSRGMLNKRRSRFDGIGIYGHRIFVGGGHRKAGAILTIAIRHGRSMAVCEIVQRAR